MIESQGVVVVNPVEPGRSVRRGLWVALGFVVALAAYAEGLARQPAAWSHHWPDRWSQVASVCTPLDVDAQVGAYEGGVDELLCYAAAGRFDQVRERLGVPGYPSIGAVAWEVHRAAHRGDRRARAVFDAFGGRGAVLDRGLEAYRAGDDARAIELLAAARAGCRGDDPTCQPATEAVRDIANHVPVASRHVQCPDEPAFAWIEADEWVACRHAGDRCAIDPPLHPWLIAREACTDGVTLPLPGIERVDPLLCLAAAGHVTEAMHLDEPHIDALLSIVEPFLADDPRALAVVDAMAKSAVLRSWTALRIARLEAQHCHVAIAKDLIARVPDNMPGGSWEETEVVKVRDELARCR